MTRRRALRRARRLRRAAARFRAGMRLGGRERPAGAPSGAVVPNAAPTCARTREAGDAGPNIFALSVRQSARKWRFAGVLRRTFRRTTCAGTCVSGSSMRVRCSTAVVLCEYRLVVRCAGA